MTKITLARRIIAHPLGTAAQYVDEMREQHGDKLVQDAINYLSTLLMTIGTGGHYESNIH